MNNALPSVKIILETISSWLSQGLYRGTYILIVTLDHEGKGYFYENAFTQEHRRNVLSIAFAGQMC